MTILPASQIDHILQTSGDHLMISTFACNQQNIKELRRLLFWVPVCEMIHKD